MAVRIYSFFGSKVNHQSTSGLLPTHFRCISGVFLVHIRNTLDRLKNVFCILGQRDEELFMDKTMVESMPKFRLRHYSYHEKNWTYGGKLYNGEFFE